MGDHCAFISTQQRAPNVFCLDLFQYFATVVLASNSLPRSSTEFLLADFFGLVSFLYSQLVPNYGNLEYFTLWWRMRAPRLIVFIEQEVPGFLVEDFSSSLGPLFCTYETIGPLISSSSKSRFFFKIVSFFCLFAKLSTHHKSIASFSQLFNYIHFCLKAPILPFSGACLFFRVLSPFKFVSFFSILITLVFGQNWEILVGLIRDTELPMFFGLKFSVVCDRCFAFKKLLVWC